MADNDTVAEIVDILTGAATTACDDLEEELTDL
jgi:hypothetical protein